MKKLSRSNRSETPRRMTRATFSLEVDKLSELEQIAEKKKVPLSWVLRDAVDAYLSNRWPLLHNE
jgi:predicted transcriptional regulator